MIAQLNPSTWDGFSIYLKNDRKNLVRNGELRRQVKSVYNNLYPFFQDKEFSRENFNLFLDWKRAKDNSKDETLNSYIKVAKNLDRYFALTLTAYSLQFIDYKEFPKVKKRKVPLTYEEMELIASTHVYSDPISNKRWQLLVTVLMLTGCRITELCYLEKDMVDYDFITFTNIKARNSETREVVLPIEVCRQLKELANGKYVFSFDGKRPVNDRSAYEVIKHKASKAGVTKKVNCHIFRHSFVSNMANSGASIVDLRDIAGHDNISTTNTYLHSDMNKQRATLTAYHPLYKKDVTLEDTRRKATEYLEQIVDHTRFSYKLIIKEIF